MRRGVVPWLGKFFAEADGGIFFCVARTSCDWFHEFVLPNAELVAFPRGKTRFIQPDGSPGPAPTNGVALIAKGEIACEALRRSGLGFCVIVDRGAAPPSMRTNNVGAFAGRGIAPSRGLTAEVMAVAERAKGGAP